MYSQINRTPIVYILFIVLGSVFQTATANPDANKAVIERWTEIWNTGDLTIADEIFAPDFINHDPSVPNIVNLEAWKGLVVMSRIATPDLNLTIEDMIAEGDKVAVRLSAIGTQSGEFMGIPPTGIQVTNTRITTFRFADEKIVEAWENYDILGVLQQLGVIPPSRETFTWGEPSTITGDPGDPATNKPRVQRMIDEVFSGNLDVVDELFAADYIMHDPTWPMEVKGPKGFKQWAGAMLEPYFSNGVIAVNDLIAEEDKVAVRWVWGGTHAGEFLGIPPTGRHIEITGTSIHRFADGKFVESWVSYDALGMVQQLTTPEWPITGAWMTVVPVPDLGNIVGQWTVSPQNPEGTNFTSVIRPAKPEATVFGTFPDADHQSDHIGPTVKVGLNTYESTLIGYGTKKAELPGMLPEIVYISVIYSKVQLIDENNVAGGGTHAFFLPSADADGDGLPDEGQEPVVCLPYTITSKRVGLMLPCVPAPIP